MASITDEEIKELYLKLCTARGLAINAYAGVESSMAVLLAHFGDMPEDVAHVIFYRIVNTRSRLDILERLKKRKIGDKHDKFWRSVCKEIKMLDESRNALAHWHAKAKVPPWDLAWNYVLKSPKLYAYSGEEELTVEQCEGFASHCAVVSFVLNQFWGSLEKRPPPTDAWLDIFQRELEYPTPESHPLYPMLIKHLGPPRSSA